jgi:hypothetical protein
MNYYFKPRKFTRTRLGAIASAHRGAAALAAGGEAASTRGSGSGGRGGFRAPVDPAESFFFRGSKLSRCKPTAGPEPGFNNRLNSWKITETHGITSLSQEAN